MDIAKGAKNLAEDIVVKSPPQKGNYDEDEWTLSLELLDTLDWEIILSSTEEFVYHLREDLSCFVEENKNICEIAEFQYAGFKMATDKLKDPCNLKRITQEELEDCFREHVNDQLRKEEGLPADHPVALLFPENVPENHSCLAEKEKQAIQKNGHAS